jgi:phosphohistidine phosphatase
MYTTNEEDQRKAAEIQAQLEQDSNAAGASSSTEKIASVSMDEGAHKYVLMSANDETNKTQHFVVSSEWAHYHRDAAEPMIETLRRSGYSMIRVLGGGRIHLDSQKKVVSIFGFSYGFGQADHKLSKQVVEADPRYKDFKVETSNEGY